MLIGLVGLVFHDLIYVPVTGWACDSLFPALGGGPRWALPVGLAGLLILPQSIMLGATFPLAGAGLIPPPPRAGRRCCRSSISRTAWVPRPASSSPGSCWSRWPAFRAPSRRSHPQPVGRTGRVLRREAPPRRRPPAKPRRSKRLHPLRERRIADCTADARAAPAHRRARHRHRVLRLRGGVDSPALAGRRAPRIRSS